jgi:hypothetical protein
MGLVGAASKEHIRSILKGDWSIAMSEMIFVQSCEVTEKMSKAGKPYKSLKLTTTEGKTLTTFPNKFPEVAVGQQWEVWTETNDRGYEQVSSATRIIQSDGGFYDGPPTEHMKGVPTETPTATQQQLAPKMTPELLAENLEWCWDAAGVILGGEEGVKESNYPTRHSLTATLFIQMGRTSNWKTDFEASAGGETAVAFLKTELRKNYNNSKLPPDWKERVAVAGKSTAAMELLTCLFDSTNVLIDIKREEAQENARMAAPLTDGDIPF